MRLKTFVFVILSWLLPATLLAAEDRVSLQLLWKHQFQFAGYYVAQQKGYYAEAGLKVDIKEFNNDVDLVGDVVAGQNTFAVGRSSLIVDKGKGSPIVALMAAFQQSPLMLISKASTGIERPEDLRGKGVMLTSDAGQVAEVLAMMLRVGITTRDFNRQNHSFNLNDLVEGRTDAYGAYLSNEPYQMEQMGIPYRVLHPRDFGFDMYSDILFTSEKYLAANPEKVQAFLHASIRGWEYAFANIDETAALIHRLYNSQERSLAALRYEGRVLKELAYAGVDQFGEISALRFQQMVNIYLIAGALDKGYSLDGFVYTPPKLASGIQLSQALTHYLLNNRRLFMCVNPNAMPYDGIVRGTHQGVVSGYVAKLADMLGIDLELVKTASRQESHQALVEDRCQILTTAMHTPQGAETLRFSRPYTSTPVGLATKADDQFDLYTGVYAVTAGSAFQEIIVNRYPAASVVEVGSIVEAISMLVTGEVQGVVAAKEVLEQSLKSHRSAGIVVGSQFNDSWDLSIAVKPQDQRITEIFNTAITHLSQLDHELIRDQWIPKQSVSQFNMRLFWQVFSVIGLLLVFLGYRYKVVNDYNRRLKKLAAYDQLTGISNRHTVSSKLNDHISIANRYGRKLSVVFFDVDNFKRVNDTYGHIAGDEVLMDISSAVQMNIRKADIFGRWGGDEFIVLLPEQGIEQARLEAEKLRDVIEKHHFPFGGRVTCSFGVAQFHPGMDEDALITMADKALYRAKENGRNQVAGVGFVLPEAQEIPVGYDI